MAHLSSEALADRLSEAGREVEVGTRYAHYKDPSKEYLVKLLGILEATEEVAVIYEAQYGDKVSFIRPLESFCATVVVDGISTPRFAKIRE